MKNHIYNQKNFRSQEKCLVQIEVIPLGQLYTVLRFLHPPPLPLRKTWDFTGGQRLELCLQRRGVGSVLVGELRFHMTQTKT